MLGPSPDSSLPEFIEAEDFFSLQCFPVISSLVFIIGACWEMSQMNTVSDAKIREKYLHEER